MSNNRKQRAAIAQETLNILEQGFYHNSNGDRINIAADLTAAQQRTIHYRVEDFDAVVEQCDRHSPHSESTQITVTNETTLDAANRLVVEQGQTNVMVLNFASAKNPGGGFLGGSQAQEESLARATGLYPCLTQHMAFYQTHRQQRSTLYSDAMIYSPALPVVRDSEDVLLEQPYSLSILTSPAVNAGALRQNGCETDCARIESVMLARVEKVLAIAMAHGHRAIVLGAWGCGVFKNDPQDIARYFHQQLLRNPRFKGAFERVLFAVLDHTPTQRTFQAFHDVFDSCP